MLSYSVIEWGEPLQEMERPLPEPHGREVLVRTIAAGVCHSDLHIHDGYYDMGGGKRKTAADRGLTLPRTMGHEIAGEVLAVGPEADGVSVGDTVAVYPWIGCGECPACQRGEENNCQSPRNLGIMLDGGYATHVLVPDAKYCVSSEGIPDEVAPLYACSGLTTFSAVRRIKPEVMKNEPVLFIGAGGLGMMAISILKALGGYGPIVVDVDDAKLEAARELGAVATVNSAREDAPSRIRELSPDGRGLRAAVDFTGIPATFTLAYNSLVKGCQLIMVGLMGGEVTISLPNFPFLNMSIEGNYTGSLQDMKDVMDLARAGKIVAPRVTTRPIGEAQAALDDLRNGRVIGRTVLVPE